MTLDDANSLTPETASQRIEDMAVTQLFLLAFA
jgi:hypothetical protein